MQKHIFGLLIACALILSACDALRPTPVARRATDTPAPPTLTRAPTLTPTPENTRTPGPTNTLVVPLVTPDPNQTILPPVARTTGTATPRPTRRPANPNDPIAVAWDKVEKATRYRSQISWVIGATTNRVYEEIALLDLTTAHNGADLQMFGKGLLMVIFTGDPNRAFEAARVAGKTYTKGMNLLGLLNLDPNAWYVADSASTHLSFSTASEQRDLTNDVRTEDFRRARVENFDNQLCDVYLADLRATENAQLKKMIGTTQDTRDLGALDRAEGLIWLCRDGYIHQVKLEYAGHDQSNEAEKGVLRLLLRFWDFDSATIVIQPPRDARALPK